MSVTKPAVGRVLVMDDEQALAELIAIMLAESGYEVAVAHSVAEAAGLLNAREFDVALLDLDLPDGSGSEILRKLLDEGALTEAIMLTGNRDIPAVVEVMKLGASDYLVKPAPLADVPLRERPGDVLPLSVHFMKMHGIRKSLSPRALEAMKSYSWPGNVRELEMVVRRAGALALGESIEPRDLPFGGATS